MLRLTNGEVVVEQIDNVEDVKGNNGDRGLLCITNLRLLWHAVATPRINLSIGYKTITGITTKIAKSKIRGQVESLCIISKGVTTTKFEFVFTCVNFSNTKLFSTVIGIHRSYETSKLFREMKMRGSLLTNDEKLNLLPTEYQCERINGVWNLSSEQGNLGVLILTNIRLVWYASLNLQYNVSVPYFQLRNCRIRDSKFGLALVLDTSIQSGEYILGFRVDPPEKLETVFRSIQALNAAFQTTPNFGVQYIKERNHVTPNKFKISDNEINEIEIEEKPMRIDAFSAYFTDGTMNKSKEEKRLIVFSEELNLAIEQLKPGFTIADLWEINVE